MKCDNCEEELDSKHINTFRFVTKEHEEIGWCLCHCCEIG